MHSSDAGVRAALTCRTSPPDSAVKRAAWERFVAKESDLSGHQRDAGMKEPFWFSFRQIWLVLDGSTRDLYLGSIRTNFSRWWETFSRTGKKNLLEHLLAICSLMSLKMTAFLREQRYGLKLNHLLTLKTLLSSLGAEEQHLRHVLKELVDDLERARKCRAVAEI